MDLKISDSLPFKGLYNATAYVQEHTLINRGITTLGGSTIPQCIMSNNKYEAQERALMGGIYFIASYLTPIILLPIYNKHFLKNKGIIKNLTGPAKHIIQVSKKYLTHDADLKKGLDETAKLFDIKKGDQATKKAFDEIYTRYDNPQKLKKDLLSVHEKVLMTDFITTGAMWSLIPWIATETTERRTHRQDFSAGFNLKQDRPKTKNQLKESKANKIFWNVLFATIPGILFAKAVTKGLSHNTLKTGENIFTKSWNKILTKISKNAHNFDYASGTNMSKTIYAAIWILSSFPAKIISSRDNNERKDRALRDIGLFTMFFGGDFLINNITGRIADKIFGTKIMKDDGRKRNFFEKFGLSLRNFKDIEKTTKMSPDILRKTKNIGAGLYWFSLLTNTALIGFGLPKILNKMLRYNISKNETNQMPKSQNTVSFEKFTNKI